MMKKVFFGLTILLFINTGTMAQRGFDLQKNIIINVPAEELWEMVGPGFVDVYKWASNVDHAEGTGTPEFEGAICSERFCDINAKGFSKVSEKLINYDVNRMNLAYEVFDGMPSFVTKAANDWTVEAVDGNRSKLIMKATFRTKGFMGWMMNGMMKRKMGKLLDTVLNDAKIYAETGVVSETKQKRIDNLKNVL